MPMSRARARLLVPVLIGPALIGAALGVFLQVTRPETRVYVTASPGLLVGMAGLLASVALAAVVVIRRGINAAAEAAEAALRDAKARAAQDRWQFLLRLDHELKNPLTAIRAALANIEHAGATAADGIFAGEALASVSSQANRITQLLSDLRKLADLETREIEMEAVDLPDLLHEVEEAVGAIPEARERAIRMNVPLAPWPLPLIDGDRDLLFIALQNLVSNAVKFSAPSDTVEVRASEDGSWLLLEVADTGAGIPDDEIEEVWQELARGRAARSLPGTGIGLALVRVVVTRHGGQVAIRSREGQGTVVTIRLPLPDGSAKNAPAVADPRLHHDPLGKVHASLPVQRGGEERRVLRRCLTRVQDGLRRVADGDTERGLAALADRLGHRVRCLLGGDRRGAEGAELVQQRPVRVRVVEIDRGALGAAGRDRRQLQHVHRHAEVVRLDGQGLRERLECPLAGAVRADQRDDEPPLDAGDKDELAVAPFSHLRQHPLRDPQGPERVQLEQVSQRVERNRLQRRAHGRARVADQHVDLSRVRERGVDRGLVSNVELQLHRSRDVLQHGGVASSGDDLMSLRGQGDRGALADPAGRSSDQYASH
jgi:two-component system, OmpR family, sensor kinase